VGGPSPSKRWPPDGARDRLPFTLSILLEQEVKFRLSSWEDGVGRLESAGASCLRSRYFESNQLFDFGDSRIAKRDSALRLRFVGDEAWLTWKGPHLGSGKIKQRKEAETFLGDGRALEAILESLGLLEEFRYEKYRATYRLGEVEASCDETPIGAFMELEGTPEAIAEAAASLTLDMAEAMSSSYPRLYQLHRTEHPDSPEFMIFPKDPSATR
jgi:adenylate cyclase class 2